MAGEPVEIHLRAVGEEYVDVTARMLREYVTGLYLPAVRAGEPATA